MKILLEQVGKRYSSGWVVRNVNLNFKSGSITGISGKNGSGKSTLLQLISSILTPTEGAIEYKLDNRVLPLEEVPLKITHSAPNIDLINSLTISETLKYHFAFRKMLENEDFNSLLELIWLADFKNATIEELSSGMKQRLKLVLSFFSQTDVILLDEPSSNLDQQGIDLVNKLVANYHQDRTIIIASNESRDFEHCELVLNINQWK